MGSQGGVRALRRAVIGYSVKKKEDQNFIFLIDPYAKLLWSHQKWGDTSSYTTLGKVIVPSPFDWEGVEPPRIVREELSICEMHVRGFTQDSSSHVLHPGTFLGIIEKIPALKEMGFTAVELMPIFEFNEVTPHFVNPYTNQPLCNYFGYAPLSFFSPMNRYTTCNEGEKGLIEFKTLENLTYLNNSGFEIKSL